MNRINRIFFLFKTLFRDFLPFIKYCFVGVSGTVIDLAALYIFVEYLHLKILVAATFSFVLAVTNNFFWNKTWTFKNIDTNYRKQYIKFLMVSIVGLGLNTFFMSIFVYAIKIWYMFAKALTSFIVLIWNFLANKYWTFRLSFRNIEIPKQFTHDFSIIIPAYNEDQRIGNTLDSIRIFIEQNKIKTEILAVNDGSTDLTSKVINEKQRGMPYLRLIEYSENQGKGFAIKQGIGNALGKYILFIDADNSTPIEELKILAPYLNEFDIVLGSRWFKKEKIKLKQPWYRIMLSRFGNSIIRFFLLENIKDTQCGFKMLSHKAAKEIFSRQRVKRFAFDIEMITVAKSLGYRYVEVPVSWYNSPQSRVRPIRDALRTLCDLIYIKLNLWSGRYR